MAPSSIWRSRASRFKRGISLAQSLWGVTYMPMRALRKACSKGFLDAGRRRLAGYIGREATSDEVKPPRQAAHALSEVVAEQVLELYLPKKRMIRDVEDRA